MPLMPCFEPDQAEEEGKIIGKILAGYGELEVTVLLCLVAVEGQLDLPIRQLFKRMPAERRLEKACKALAQDFKNAGLGSEMDEALSDLDWCRKLRNQYAHCQWGWTPVDGLFFVNLEQLADQAAPIQKVMDHPRRIDVPLLQEQEAYCDYVRMSFMHLDTAYRAWDRMKSGVRQATTYVFPKPAKKMRPRLHK
jgi:hypothetical protein